MDLGERQQGGPASALLLAPHRPRCGAPLLAARDWGFEGDGIGVLTSIAD